jgi:hypothetical protein
MASKKSQQTPGGFMPKKSAVDVGRAPRTPAMPKVGVSRKSNQLPAKGGKRK